MTFRLEFVWEALKKHMEQVDENHFTCKPCFHPDRGEQDNSRASTTAERVACPDCRKTYAHKDSLNKHRALRCKKAA